MQPKCLVRAHRSLGVLLLVGLASLSAFAGETSPEADRNALALGTVTVLGPATCLSGSTKGAACTSINVSCPGVPDLTAMLSEAFPTSAAMGTIILNSGGDGTTFSIAALPTPISPMDSASCNSHGPPSRKTPAAEA